MENLFDIQKDSNFRLDFLFFSGIIFFQVTLQFFCRTVFLIRFPNNISGFLVYKNDMLSRQFLSYMVSIL